MGTSLSALSPSTTFDTLLKTNLEGPLTTTITQICDGAGNDSPLYLATDKIGFNEAVDMTKTSTEINSTVDKVAFISVTQNVDLDTIESNSNASKTKTDFITVTQNVDLDTIESNSNASKTKTDFITVTQNVDLDTMESDISSVKTKTDNITITQAVNLDTIETDVTNLKALTWPIQLACSDETTAISAATGKITFRMPFAMTVTAVRASLTTAQTSGSIFTVDINDGGTSILSTKLTIDNTEKTSTTAATAAVISDTALADDAEITIDVDQIGDGTAKGLKVTIIGTR